MSSTEQQQCINGPGFRIYKNLIQKDQASKIFNFTTLEICFYVFGDRAQSLIDQLKFKTTQLICDAKLRNTYNVDVSEVRNSGNSRDSKVLKKSGKTSLYLCPYVREGIYHNTDVYNVLKEVYGNPNLAFSSDLDPIIYKPNMSECSIPILDCDFRSDLESSTSLNNPQHYTCFVSVSPNTTAEVSKLHLLVNFDKYYDAIRYLIKNKRCTITSQKKSHKTTILDELSVDYLNSELKKIIPSNFEPLYWKRIDLEQGDMIIFDCKIPYKTSKNRSGMPQMLVSVPLRPISSDWYNTEQCKNIIRALTDGKTGDWKKRSPKNCNIDEYRWRNSLKTNLMFANMKSCTNTSSLTDSNKRLYGLIKY